MLNQVKQKGINISIRTQNNLCKHVLNLYTIQKMNLWVWHLEFKLFDAFLNIKIHLFFSQISFSKNSLCFKFHGGTTFERNEKQKRDLLENYHRFICYLHKKILSNHLCCKSKNYPFLISR